MIAKASGGEPQGFTPRRFSVVHNDAARFRATMTIPNPILRGFSPDPSIVRVGEDYYIATSTFEWFPGVRLHHSRDLVHWREVGFALNTVAHLDLRGIPDSGGVWAPSLSHADGQFWLIYTNVRTCGIGRPFKDLSIYLTTAPAIEGPWAEPIELNSIGFDPSLFHDDDGRKWLVNMEWDFRPAGVARFAGIVIQEYDPRARKLVGATTKILKKPILCEGPNIYKRDGWYYLMLAEGGTGWEHGIAMARARAITGPYELDPQGAVLTTRDVPHCPLQKAGHGELVETPEGEWYLAHLASRPVVAAAKHSRSAAPARSGRSQEAAPIEAGLSIDGSVTQRSGVASRASSVLVANDDPGDANDDSPVPLTSGRCVLGRETCLQKVIWSPDGWLRLDPAVRAGAKEEVQPWHPRLIVPAPKGIAPAAWPPLPPRDDFDATALEVTWNTLRVPADETWLSLRARPGWLRLRGRDSLHSLFRQSLVAKPLRSVRCVVETCLEFEPTHFTQMAGLVCYYDTRTHYYLRVTHHETHGKVLGIVLTDDTAYREPRSDGAATEQISVAGWPRYFLRATFDGVSLQFSASPDGKQWRALGPVLDATKLSDDYGQALHFTGAMVGLCAQDVANTGATADFDYFSIDSG